MADEIIKEVSSARKVSVPEKKNIVQGRRNEKTTKASSIDSSRKGEVMKPSGAKGSGGADVSSAVLERVNDLVKEIVQGRLKTRADLKGVSGSDKEILEGINQCIDAIVIPLDVAAKYVDDISKGNIPAKITETYNGDFNTIKNNLNQCIDAVNMLVADAGLLSKAAVDGKLATRADASKHSGDFRKIVQGVDDCLDAVIGPLNVAAEYVDRISKGDIPPKISDKYNGDFN